MKAKSSRKRGTYMRVISPWARLSRSGPLEIIDVKVELLLGHLALVPLQERQISSQASSIGIGKITKLLGQAICSAATKL